MAAESYISAAEYAALTSRPIGEATSVRLLRASQLLDARIGVRYCYDETTGRKLDLEELPIYKADAVKAWVAWMIVALYDNHDSPKVAESVTLGRFTMQAQNTGRREVVSLPEEVVWADEVLRDSGVIDRSIRTIGKGGNRWNGVI